MNFVKHLVPRLLGMASLFVFWNLPAAFGAHDNSIPVTGIEGYGTTREKALADAFQNAVRTALGTYVISSSVDDGETVDEKIYLNADAIVESHRIVSQRSEDGAVVVVIDASVVRNEMMKYIQRIPSVEVGEGELANLLNKRKAIDTAVKSLDLLFANWRENLFRVEKYGSMSIAGDDGLAGGEIAVDIPFIVSIRWDAYRVWRQKLMTLVDRIAVAKTSGKCQNFRAFEDVYGRSSFFESNGVGDENPHNYRAILFLDEWPEPTVGYTLYLVPFQFYQKLAGILDEKMHYRFAFSRPGGEVVLSRSIPDQCWFFVGAEFGDVSRLAIYSEPFDNDDCLVFREKVYTKADYKTVATTQTLFHATVALPEASLGSIRECTIQHVERTRPNRSLLRKQGDEGEWISTTPLTRAEWQSIDPNPGFRAREGGGTKPVLPPPSRSGERTRSQEQSRGTTAPTIRTAVEAVWKHPTLGNFENLEEVWNALPRQEKAALQKPIMWAFCAMLLAEENRSELSSRMKYVDYGQLMQTVRDECEACGGDGRIDKTCRECEGTGKCKYCHGSGMTEGHLAGRNVPCPTCNAKGRCPACAGGKIQESCKTCSGSGRLVSKAKCRQVAKENLLEALRICGEGQ